MAATDVRVKADDFKRFTKTVFEKAGFTGARSAGGAVTTLDGTPLRYNERDTLLNPHFIAYGDDDRRWPDLF